MSNSVHPGVIKTELVRGMGNTYGSFVHSIANNLSALNAYAGIMQAASFSLMYEFS